MTQDRYPDRQDSDRHERISRYLRGEMSAAETSQFDADAALDDALANEVALRQSLAGAMATKPDPETAGDGWAKLQAAMRASDAGPKVPVPEPTPNADIVMLPQKPGKPFKAANGLHRPKRFARYAAALLGVVALGQAGYIASNTKPSDARSAVYETVSEEPQVDTIQVTFVAGATEQQIRELLLSLDATMAGGPSALGVYQLRPSADADCAAISETLRQTVVVERADTCR